MTTDKTEILQRALERERAARKAAERILEEKSLELFESNQKLQKANIRQERILKQRTSQLEGVFENVIDAYVMIGLNGSIIRMNPAAYKMFGIKEESDLSSLMDLVAEKDQEIVLHNFKKLFQYGKLTNFQIEIIPRKGHPKLVQVNSSIVLDEEGKPIAAQGIARDITKEKESEIQLKRSEGRMSSLIQNMEDAILLESQNREIVLANQKFCDLFQIPAPPEALVGMNCSEAGETSKTLFKDPSGFIDGISEVLEKREKRIGEVLHMTNGTVLERNYIPIYEDGKYVGHLWTYKDVTLVNQYKEDLILQKQKYASIIANMNLGLVETNSLGEIVMVNKSIEQMTGYTAEELIGRQVTEVLMSEESRQKLETQMKKSGKAPEKMEVTYFTKAGEKRQWLLSGAPNFDANHKEVGAIGIHLDITELKELETQKEELLSKLRQNNEELKEYAHVVSHDLKSPLRNISALVSWVNDDNEELLDNQSKTNIELINRTVEKMDNLITEIIDYSAIDLRSAEQKSVNLDTLVKELITILYRPEHIQIDVKTKLPKVTGEPIRLQQVFQNLISNAIRYNNKENGLVEISHTDRGTHYEFLVKDNGIGISKEYHEKIFKIFQSLGNHEGSSGIGLSIVKKIVTHHQGNIWVESTPGEGSSFYFTLKK